MSTSTAHEIAWYGRTTSSIYVPSDNPAIYEIILTTTDSAGSAMTVRPLVTVQY